MVPCPSVSLLIDVCMLSFRTADKHLQPCARDQARDCLKSSVLSGIYADVDPRLVSKVSALDPRHTDQEG